MKRWAVVLAVAAGALLRLPQLDMRPMHTDEAVHAVKLGALLESGVYRYDKNEYHGPTLNYLTLLPAALTSQLRLRDLEESTLRIVPVALGLVLLLLIPFLRDAGGTAVALVALFTALSPAMTYFSRYYIQEMLLVCFTFALILAGYQLLKTGRPWWAVAAGTCAGLMHATKETSLIAFGVLVIALAVTSVVCRRTASPFPRIRPTNVLFLLLSASAVSVLFYSSFGSNWQGVADSVLTYQTYFSRAGANAGHEQPWYYYLLLLGWWHAGEGPVWSEALTILFGIVGVWAAFRRTHQGDKSRHLLVFLALYACTMWVVYSIIPYKTPWSILGAHHGLIVMAGIGAVEVWEWMARRRLRWLAVALVAGWAAFLGWQSYRANFVFDDDPCNPYVYAHPRRDVLLVARVVEDVVTTAPDGMETPVQVIVPADDYWPLPWHLRRLSRVGWWDGIRDEFTPTPVILAAPEVEQALLERLYEDLPAGERPLYVPLFDRPLELRPGKEIRGYVTLELRNRAGQRPL